MEDHAQANHDKRQPWRSEGEQTEEAQHGVGMPSTPDIYQRTAERRAEERLVEERCQTEQRCSGIRKHPGEVRGRRS